MSENEAASNSEERPLDDIERDENPGDIVLGPEQWVDDVQVEDE
jgi:hypothetical protein